MGGRPPKPAIVLEIDNTKQRRSKAELEARKQAEQSLLTQEAMKEWPEVAENPDAHKEFTRLRRLLKKINHNDAIHESVINRYCLLLAEAKDAERTKQRYLDEIDELREIYQRREIDAMTYLDKKDRANGQILAWDKQLMDKRKMLLQIERENVMTIMGALRAIPKKVTDDKPKSGMAKFLNRRGGGGEA